MAMNILVLHGPNLNLLGERPGDAPERTLEALNRLLRERALTLRLELRIVQSNHEGVLVDQLQAERKWAEGILVSPGALARAGHVLRDALVAVGKPFLEVHLDEYRNAEGKRLKSVFKDAAAGRVLGKGFDSYLEALERFAIGELDRKLKSEKQVAGPRRTLGPKARAAEDDVVDAVVKGGEGKTLGPKRAEKPAATARTEKTLGPKAKPEPAPESRAEKTLGPKARGAEKAKEPEKSLGRKEKEPESGVLSRALVRRKIADRLAGKMTAADLASWARAQWLEVQRGAPAGGCQDELLELVAISSMAQSRVADEKLLDLMSRLEE